MTLDEIADLWAATHGPEPRRRKLGRGVAARFPELERYPDDLVRRGVEAAGNPGEILWRIRELQAVEASTGTLGGATPAAQAHREVKAGLRAPRNPYCRHAVPKARCVVCAPSLTDILYITGGGTHIHRRPDCWSLASGQEQVRRRGGSPEEIQPVNTYDGRLRDRDWCKTCGGFASRW